MAVAHQSIKISFTHFPYPQIFAQIPRNKFPEKTFKHQNSSKTKSHMLVSLTLFANLPKDIPLPIYEKTDSGKC